MNAPMATYDEYVGLSEEERWVERLKGAARVINARGLLVVSPEQLHDYTRQGALLSEKERVTG